MRATAKHCYVIGNEYEYVNLRSHDTSRMSNQKRRNHTDTQLKQPPQILGHENIQEDPWSARMLSYVGEMATFYGLYLHSLLSPLQLRYSPQQDTECLVQ